MPFEHQIHELPIPFQASNMSHGVSDPVYECAHGVIIIVIAAFYFIHDCGRRRLCRCRHSSPPMLK